MSPMLYVGGVAASPSAASPKYCVVQLGGYPNAALSKCGVVVVLNSNPKFSVVLILTLTLASCKNRTRNLVLTLRVSRLSTEPPQVLCM